MSLFTVDDMTLLRAIQRFEEHEPREIPSSGDDITPAVISVMQERVINSEGFATLKSNDHLRTLLKTFLEKNIAVERRKADQSHGYWSGLVDRFNRGKTERLEQEILLLEAERDEAFKPYEMLRKLSDPDNHLLKRHPA